MQTSASEKTRNSIFNKRVYNSHSLAFLLRDKESAGAENLMDAAEQQVRSPPPSLIPRLHVVYQKKLQHSNPLLPDEISAQLLQEKGKEVCSVYTLNTCN